MSCLPSFVRSGFAARQATLGLLLTLAAFGSAGNAAVVDFEDLGQGPNAYYLPSNALGGYYWNGPSNAGGFTSGGVAFNNSNPGWWSGWAYSNVADIATPGPDNSFGAYTGSGVGGTGNYAIGYVGNPTFGDVLPTITIPSGMHVQSAMFTNATYAAVSMLKGDSFAKKFEASDWFMLTITGRDATNNSIGSVAFPLAENGSILNAWQSADLSSLSEARSLQFTLSSSDASTYDGVTYMNTPAYFAMDNLTLTTPEPSTFVLAVSGIAAFLLWRKRQAR